MLKYIELKTGHADNGPAWIARVEFSKSGRTVYFDGKALKRTSSGGGLGNHYDLATGDEYWVSGIKKDGSNRHWAGAGVVSIQASAVAEFLSLTETPELDRGRFRVIEDLPKTSPAEFESIEHRPLRPVGSPGTELEFAL